MSTCDQQYVTRVEIDIWPCSGQPDQCIKVKAILVDLLSRYGNFDFYLSSCQVPQLPSNHSNFTGEGLLEESGQLSKADAACQAHMEVQPEDILQDKALSTDNQSTQTITIPDETKLLLQAEEFATSQLSTASGSGSDTDQSAPGIQCSRSTEDHEGNRGNNGSVPDEAARAGKVVEDRDETTGQGTIASVPVEGPHDIHAGDVTTGEGLNAVPEEEEEEEEEEDEEETCTPLLSGISNETDNPNPSSQCGRTLLDHKDLSSHTYPRESYASELDYSGSDCDSGRETFETSSFGPLSSFERLTQTPSTISDGIGLEQTIESSYGEFNEFQESPFGELPIMPNTILSSTLQIDIQTRCWWSDQSTIAHALSFLAEILTTHRNRNFYITHRHLTKPVVRSGIMCAPALPISVARNKPHKMKEDHCFSTDDEGAVGYSLENLLTESRTQAMADDGGQFPLMVGLTEQSIKPMSLATKNEEMHSSSDESLPHAEDFRSVGSQTGLSLFESDGDDDDSLQMPPTPLSTTDEESSSGSSLDISPAASLSGGSNESGIVLEE